jgi:putative membrane protein
VHSITKAATAVLVGATIALTGATAASAAPSHPSHHPRLNRTDIAFLKSNEQVNLAEITIGHFVVRHANGADARELARVTIRDHRMARSEVRMVAAKDNIRLPQQPNAMQQKVARQLRSAYPCLGYDYFKAQIMGHKQSIAQTKHEIRAGSRPNVIRYAKAYLPVAEMHLRMARQDLARLGHC